MSLHDPFDSTRAIARCNCGHHGSQAEHDASLQETEALNQRVLQTTVMRALFPEDGERRKFLSAVEAQFPR